MSKTKTYILIVNLNDEQDATDCMESLIGNEYVSAVISDDFKVVKKDSLLDPDAIPNVLGKIKSEELSLFLRRLNLLPNHNGFHYLLTAIAYQLSNPDQPVYITKSVYPYVAKKYNSTPSRIERCMRTAITHFWESDGRAKFETIAGFPVERKPTNSEFISLSAEYIRLHRDQFYK
ncbi:MAG TPA: sporulation initiation factor Spo0A C-terminal domain-containing protein [Firmicutes bacterium]|nr:sporulation initiation factor Spo0A C-terminal domain-containing protein [Bacillota bacterium]